MTKTFAIGVLAILVVLLAVMTQIVRRASDPPPPPTEANKAQQTKVARESAAQQAEEMKKRALEMKKRAREQAQKARIEAQKHGGATASADAKKPLPAGALDIGGDWFKKRPEGEAGIEKLQAEAAKNQPGPSTPRPVSAGG